LYDLFLVDATLNLPQWLDETDIIGSSARNEWIKSPEFRPQSFVELSVPPVSRKMDFSMVQI